jgi:Septum formation
VTTGGCPNCGYEAAHVTRFCPRCGNDLEAAGGDGASTASTRPPRGRSPRVRMAAGAAVLVAAVAVGVVARPRHETPRPVAAAPSSVPRRTATTRASTNETTTTDRTFVSRSYSIGDCVMWKPSHAENIETQVVGCDQPHLVEVVGKVDLENRLHHLPSDGELQILFMTDCTRAATALLGHAPADSGIQVGGLYPKREAWDRGDRTLWCWARKSAPATAPGTPFTGALT